MIHNIKDYDNDYNDWIINNDNEEKKQENEEKNNESFFIIDTGSHEAFGHWVFESAIYLDKFKELKKTIPDLKLALKSMKKYKKLFLDFFDIIDIHVGPLPCPNICYINTLYSLNKKEINDDYKMLVSNLFSNFDQKIEKSEKTLLMPRQKLENFKPNDRTYDTDFLEKNITNVLHTDFVEKLSDQIKRVKEASDIILTDGSPFLVNGMFARNSNIFIIGNVTPGQRTQYPKMNYIITKINELNKCSHINALKE